MSIELLEDIGELILISGTKLVCGLAELPSSIVLPAVAKDLETLGIKLQAQPDVVFTPVTRFDQHG